jgi:hypothetical protein
MQSYNTHNLGISRFPLWSPKTKSHINIIHTTRSKVYYKEEGGDLLPSQGCINNESKASSWPKVNFILTNRLHVDFILTNHLHNLTCVNDLIVRCLWMYHFILIHILKLPHTPLSLVHGIENYTPIFFFFYFLSIAAFGEFISQALGRT